MKKAHVIIIFLSFAVCLSLTACSSKSSQSTNEESPQNSVNTADDEPDELSVRLKHYKSFLKGEIGSKDKSGDILWLSDFCYDFTPENHEISYALFDMTGDGLPELHVFTSDIYSIHTIENNQLIMWHDGGHYQKPLNNGAILEKKEGTGTHYAYIVLDSKGEEVFSCGFAKPPEGSKLKYLFSTGDDDIELSKSDWDKLTKPFLNIGSDKIIWKDINNLDFDSN